MKYKYRKELTDEQNKKLREIFKNGKTHANIKGGKTWQESTSITTKSGSITWTTDRERQICSITRDLQKLRIRDW